MTHNRYSMLLAGLLAVTSLGLFTGCKGVNMYSTQDELQLGKEAAQELEKKDVKLSKDASDNELVQEIGKKLIPAVKKVEGGSDIPWQFTFKVAEDKSVNAFSLPGGPVYVNTGLIKLAEKNPDMVASVMGHEMAHIVRRHAAKQISSGKLMGAVVAVGLGNDKSGIGDIANLASGLTQMKFSRDDEYQADEYGLKYMYAAGYKSEATVDFFTRLQKDAGKKDSGFMINLSDHPNTGARIERLKKLITKLPPR